MHQLESDIFLLETFSPSSLFIKEMKLMLRGQLQIIQMQKENLALRLRRSVDARWTTETHTI